MLLFKKIFILIFTLGYSSGALAGFSFETKNLKVRTFDKKSLEDNRFANKLLRLSRDVKAEETLGTTFNRGHFLESKNNFPEVMRLIRTDQKFFISMGVFLEEQLVGVTIFSSLNQTDYRHELFDNSNAKYVGFGLLDYALFIFPEYKGMGFVKELVAGNLEFAFKELKVSGLISTSYKDSVVSVVKNLGQEGSVSETYKISREGEGISFVDISNIENQTLACSKILD